MLQSALKSLRLDREAGFFRNNVDHYSGATFGCHENYLVRRAAPLTEQNVQSLLTFLTLRLLYVSAGNFVIYVIVLILKAKGTVTTFNGNGPLFAFFNIIGLGSLGGFIWGWLKTGPQKAIAHSVPLVGAILF